MMPIEMLYFVVARDFFRSKIDCKLDLYKDFIEKESVIFIYNLALEKKVKKANYGFCNFNFWMYCVYYTFSNIAFDFINDDALAEKVVRSKNYLNKEILKILSDGLGDEELIKYYSAEFDESNFNIDLNCGFLKYRTFDMNEVVDFSEFIGPFDKHSSALGDLQ